jgi:hypothetical protein
MQCKEVWSMKLKQKLNLEDLLMISHCAMQWDKFGIRKAKNI